MKQFLRYTLTLIAILIATTNAWAAATCHTVTKSTFTTDASYQSGGLIKRTYYYYSPSDQPSFTISNDLNTISQISFTATGDTRDGDLKFKVIYKTANNSSWQEIGNEITLARYYDWGYKAETETITLKTSSYPELAKATEIGLRFTTYNSNSSGYQSNKRTITISNVSVTFSHYFQSDANNTTLEAFPPTEKGTTCSTTRSFTYKYNNTVTSVKWESSNPMFSVSSKHEEDCSEEKEVTITFTPTEIRSEITGTITGTDNNGNEIVVYVKGSSWGKEDPTYTWKPEIWDGTSQARTIYVGETINDMLSYTSSPANCTYTIEKLQDYGINNGDATTTFTNNTLVAGRAGKYKLTVSQPAHSISETSGYNAGETTITLDVVKNTSYFTLNFAGEYFVDDQIAQSTFFISPTNTEVAISVTDSEGYFSYTSNNLIANCPTPLPADSVTTTITVTQPETYKWTGKTLTKEVLVKKHPSDFSWLLKDTYYVDDVITSIFSKAANNLPTTITSSDPNIVKVEGNQLIALNAGEVTITATQDVDRKWVAFTQTKKVTILKHNIVATITPDNVYWNELVPNPFSATSTHPVSGQVTTIQDHDFNVAQQGNEHIALMDASTRNIQTYYTNGTVDFHITRPEDRKYNALNQTLTLTVNANWGCNLIENQSASANYSLGNTGATYSTEFSLNNGIGTTLMFNYKLTEGASYDHYLTPQYSLTENGDNFDDIPNSTQTTQSINPNSVTITLPDGTKRIRFKRTSEWWGTKSFSISNITVTRAQYIRPTDAGQPLNSTNALVLPTVAVGQPSSKQFHLEWSACTDIKIVWSNPKFTINTTDITTRDGSLDITVSCNTSEVGTFTDNVVIYNQEQMETFPITCEVYTKWLTDSIRGSATHSMKVDKTWETDFYFPIQRASQYPTTDGAFHYAIKHTFVDENQADRNPNYPNEVISYNNGVITAHNAGTAILTIKHEETTEHFESQQFTCTLTVSKHDVERIWNDPVYFNDTIDNYFTTSNIASDIVIESQTDTDVAKLTNEFNPTSNNSLDLITFNKEASTTVTVSQAKTYYWNGYSEPHTITPIDPNNHVTFTLTQENYISAFKHSFVDPAANDQSRGPDWQSGGIYFGGEGTFEGAEGWNWDEKYYIIQFTGIPDSIYFDASRSGAATGTIKLAVSEGKTPDNLTEVWSNSNNSENNKIIRKLNPDSRYLKFSYTGNLWGLFKNITVTELNQFEAVPDRLDFGQQYVDEPSIPKTFDFKYANAGYKVQLQSNDSHFTVEPTYIDTIGGEKYGTIKDIKVTYHPTEEHNTANTDAKIYIWDEAGHKDSVILTASAIKSTPTLSWTPAWSATEPIVLLDQTVTNAATSSNGYSTVKYRSSNEDIIQIINDGAAFKGKGTGRVEITAYQEPDRVYNAAEISKTFIVTDKIAQYIVWEDNLTNLRIGDDPITLNAQVWVMTDAASNTWEYSPAQTAELQYSSPDSDIVSIENNILTINGVGELLIDATIPADETYEYAHAQIPVRVRDNSTTCSDEDLIIPVKKDGTAFELTTTLEYNPYLSTSEHIVEIDRTAGIPGELIFGYYGREAWWTLSGRIRVYESSDNGSTWQQVLSDADAVKPKEQELQYSPRIPLSTTATHIKFQRFESINLGYHLIQYITILPAKYIQAEDVFWGNIYVGNTLDTTITFNYSSVRGDMELSTSHANLNVTPSIIRKDCGDWGTESLTITLNANTSIVGEFHEQVYIHDKVGNISETIHVYANIVKNSPTITWAPSDTIRSSAEWESNKTAIASSGDQVLYEITAGNQPDEFAYLNNDGKMILLRGGQITARAYTPATTTSNEMSVFHDFIIVVDPLFEDFANDNNWLNDNNWNIGRTPWATDSATIAANKHVLLTTEIITEGLFFESGSAIHITSTGGLTVGAQGIQGAASDGSSIIIDNLKTGAGFLRISPEYNGAMPHATINYQTRSTLDSGANQNATWQYIGAPGANCQFTVDGITWLYQWSEPQNWINKTGTLTLEPFAGYAITQYGKPTYELIAEPINQNQTITLTKTSSGMNGNNLFANSYMAPIDAKNFTPEDFSDYNTDREDIVKTFYIFNSGSWNDWNKYDTEQSKGSNGNDTPGQYCAVPAFASQYMDDAEITTLPPMQGIYVIANTDGAQIHLNYDKHVWKAGTNPDVTTDMHEPMRSPQRMQAQEQMQQDSFRRIRLQLNSANSGADRLYVIQTDETTPLYDNGYDAPNQTVDGLTNIYTTESFGKMEVSCSNHIDSMYIGFQAGSDTQYTLSFSSLIGDMLYLQDLEQDTIVAMQQDMPYTFSATPLTINDHRFRLLLYPEDYSDTPNTPTDTDPADNIRVWVNNNVLHVIGAPANSTLHIYNISGAHIFTQIISDTPYTYNLSHLSASVYLVRINNYTYKVITK